MNTIISILLKRYMYCSFEGHISNAALNFFIFFHVVVWGIGKLQYKFYYGAPLGLGDIYC